jgi:hypothetical protein
MKKRIFTVAVLIVSLVSMAAGQQPAPRAETPAPRGPDYVDHREFKNRVFEVKNRNPFELARALQALGSGFKGSTVQASDEFSTITVRDFPENIAAIEEALKRLDAPEAPRPDIELKMHLLIASNTEGASSQYPADLGEVVKQLQGTLSYKSYYLANSVLIRMRSASNNRGSGDLQLGPPLVAEPAGGQYSYNFNTVSIAPGASIAASIQIRGIDFRFHGDRLGHAEISTGIGLREGEKIVVGTATLRDKAMVLVLTARVIK